MPEFQQYPMTLTHPNARKGTAQPTGPMFDAYTGQPLPAHKRDFQGTADVFPPITVNNEDQEQQYLAKGYARPGSPNAAAFAAAHAVPEIVNGHEYYKYPMWVNGVIVKDEAEEKKARAGLMARADEPETKPYITDTPNDMAAALKKAMETIEQLRAIIADAKPPADVAQDDVTALQAQCDAGGIRFDKRWGAKRLKEALDGSSD